jgi:hypothetical protein
VAGSRRQKNSRQGAIERSAHTDLNAIVGAAGAIPFPGREIVGELWVRDGSNGGITHGRLHLKRPARGMADIASEIRQRKGHALGGRESIVRGVTNHIAFCEKRLVRRK